MTAALSMVPSVVVSAFAQPLFEGRRVIIFGSATGCLWDKALERGARLVHVCDPDPERLSQAAARNSSQSVSFAPLSSQTSLAVRDGAFDIGIIENLAALNDPAMHVRRLKRALAPRGLAFIIAPNPDIQDTLIAQIGTLKQSLDYYSLYDVVRSEFSHVRMLGQMPFVGYTVAELAPLDEPEPKLDAGFVAGGTEEPEWFIAAASTQNFDLEGFTVIQLPISEVLHENAVRHLREQLRSSRQAERSAVERLARIEAQMSQMSVRQIEQRSSSELLRQLDALKEELRRKEKWIASIEARASAADMRADEADVQVERLQQQIVQASQAQAHIVELEHQLGEFSTNAAHADKQVAEADDDVARLEALLKERGERIRALEADLAAVTRVGEQLVRDLQRASRSREVDFQSQTWGADLPVADSTQLPAGTTMQSASLTSNWANQKAEEGLANGGEAISRIKALLGERTQLFADFYAAEWRVDQLRASAEEFAAQATRAGELEGLLVEAEQHLNEQDVLVNQLRTYLPSS